MATAGSFQAFDQLQNRFAELNGVAERLGQTMAGAAEQVTAAVNKMSGGMAGFVALANPAAVWQFNWAMRDLQAVIGRILLPQFQQLTQWVRQLADWLLNLSPQMKEWIGNLVLAGGVLTVTAVAVKLFTFTLSSLAPILSLTTAGLRVLGISISSLLGPVGLVIGALTAVGGAVVAANGLGDTMDMLGELFAVFADTFREVMTALRPAMEAWVNAIKDLWTAIKPLLESLLPLAVAIVKLQASIIGVIAKALTPIITIIARLATVALQPLIWLLDKLATFMAFVADAIVSLIDFVMDALRSLPLGETVLGKKEDRDRISSKGAAVLQAQYGNLDALARETSLKAIQSSMGVKSPEEEAKQQRDQTNKALGMIAESSRRTADGVDRMARTAGRTV